MRIHRVHVQKKLRGDVARQMNEFIAALEDTADLVDFQVVESGFGYIVYGLGVHDPERLEAKLEELRGADG